MIALLDMGTTNTRLRLLDNEREVAAVRAAFGAAFGKREGRDALLSSLRTLLNSLLAEAGVSEAEVECIMTSGMAGSEMGLREVPHLEAPADAFRLADSLTELTLPEVSGIPFVIVPGIKKTCDGKITDMMRGEETEVIGILTSLPLSAPAILVLPGTHNKVIRVTEDGRITDFFTTMTGEFLDAIIRNTILAGDVSHDFTLVDAAVLLGARYTEERGLSAALFHLRVMAKNGADLHERSSFLYGAVLSTDIAAIRRFAGDAPLYVGGREILRRIYTLLLGEGASPLPTPVADGATARGLSHLASLRTARHAYAEAVAAVTREGLIAIVRRPEEETLLTAMDALYAGGVRLAEVTFDREGVFPQEKTVAAIRALRARYGGRLLVGAGTVTTKEEVLLAFRAGASFIISPTCDPAVIALTRGLGMVSIPAAFTPTEVVEALTAGADFIKLFPADALPRGFVRAVQAPIPDARFLAVGGVTAENAREFLLDGFVGVGVGSALYDKALIKAGDYAALTARAAAFVSALHRESNE